MNEASAAQSLILFEKSNWTLGLGISRRATHSDPWLTLV